MTQAEGQPVATISGIICAYRLDGSGGGRQLEDYTNADQATTGFDWVHLRSDDPASDDTMRSLGLDRKIIEALTALETRPRMQLLTDGVLVNLRGVNTNPGSDPEDMVAIRLWFNGSVIFSARRRERKLLSVEDIRERIVVGTGPASPGELVTMLTEFLANRINDVVDSIDDELTQVETDLGNQNIRQIQQRLSAIRKQTAAIRRYLAPQREALAELYRTGKHLSDQDCHSLRYQADRIALYVEELDLARERALVLHGELQNKIAEQQNSRMYLLSIVATIFLPLSFLTGVFGMNVGGLPGLENSDAFSWLTLGMTGLAMTLLVFMWWKKWL
jgi:zinc transporter